MIVFNGVLPDTINPYTKKALPHAHFCMRTTTIYSICYSHHWLCVFMRTYLLQRVYVIRQYVRIKFEYHRLLQGKLLFSDTN